MNKIPLINSRIKLLNEAIDREVLSTDRQNPSKIYLKHLKSLRTNSGLCFVLSNRKLKYLHSRALQSRITQDFDKLYDMTPLRKKQKLIDARMPSLVSSKSEKIQRTRSRVSSIKDLNTVLKENNRKNPLSKIIKLNKRLCFN